MSSNSRLSWRDSARNKINQITKSNITSSIRERVISNETYTKIREKSHNFTDTAKDLVDVGKIKNITKGVIPSVFKPNENLTSPKGFYDSLFSPQTENDVYLKVAIICLWVIAMLCIILTIITILIPIVTKRMKTSGVKMIFLHIFLCEFCYLIYILLSMINVALSFQLNSFWCTIAKYGMYATIPIMYCALLILSIERVTQYFNCTKSWAGRLPKIWVSQGILILIWIIWIVAIAIPVSIKKEFFGYAKDLRDKIIPTRFNLFSSRQCSIDGQLLPVFKILFLILFIILIILIIKSIVVSTMYTFFLPSCSGKNKKDKKPTDHNMTLIFIMILLLNLFLSSPFYFISAATSITRFFGGDKSFPMKLKISFILRISSIIFQCLIFLTLETNSWTLLCQLLGRATCGKFPGSKVNPALTNRRTPTKQSGTSKKLGNSRESDNTEEMSDAGENNGNTESSVNDQSDDDGFPDKTKNKPANAKKSKTTEKKITTHEDESDDDVFPEDTKNKPTNSKKSKTTEKKITTHEDESDDDVFLDETKTKPANAKKSRITEKEVTTHEDDSDNEMKAMPKSKSSTRKKDITKKSSQKRDEIEEETQPIKKTTSKYNNTNGISKQTSNEKSRSHRTSSAITDQKTSKSNTSHNHIKYNPILPDPSTDDISNASVSSDDEIKPSATKPKIQSTTHSSSNKQKHTPTVLSNVHHRSHHSHHHRHRTSRSQDSRPIRTRSNNHNHIETTKHRTKSPRNINDHTEKPKQDRLSKILANSIEV